MASYPIDPVVQRRLDNLELLIDTSYGGQAKVFEKRTGVKMAQLNQWFSGYRALREKAVRRLETVTGKPHGFFDAIETRASEDTSANEQHMNSRQQEEMDPERAAMAVAEALAILGDVLRALDGPGRDVASTMLSNFAKTPTDGEINRVSNVLAASVRPPSPDGPPSGPGKRKKETAQKGERRETGKASLVLTIGGGQKQQFDLPLQSLHKAIDNRNASPSERAWYERVKAAPKATGGKKLVKGRAK